MIYKFITVVMVLFAYNTTNDQNPPSISKKEKNIIKDDVIASITHTVPHTTKKLKRKTNKEFLDKLGKLESSGNYKIANKYNYVGKYQFGKTALEDIGYNNDTINKIINSVYKNKNRYYFDTTFFTPKDQEIAVRKLMHKIEFRYMNKYIKKYKGKDIGGVRITTAGILASAHLKGSGSIKKYLRSNGKENPCDALGTSVKDYLKVFETYKIVGKF